MQDQAANLIAKIATALSGEIGARFFECLVRHLAEALGADYALVGERIPGNESRVRTLAAFAHEGVVPEFEYDLAGTPCENLLQQTLCIYPAGISHLFPRDTMLVDMQAGTREAAEIEMGAVPGEPPTFFVRDTPPRSAAVQRR